MRCVLFPDDARETFGRKGTCVMAKAGKSSWERCGDSFLDTPMMEVRPDELTYRSTRTHTISGFKVAMNFTIFLLPETRCYEPGEPGGAAAGHIW